MTQKWCWCWWSRLGSAPANSDRMWQKVLKPKSTQTLKLFLIWTQFLLLVWTAIAVNGLRERGLFTLYDTGRSACPYAGLMPRFPSVPWTSGPGWNWRKMAGWQMRSILIENDCPLTLLATETDLPTCWPGITFFYTKVSKPNSQYPHIQRINRQICLLDTQIKNSCFGTGVL